MVSRRTRGIANSNRGTDGYSLAELVVVIAVIGALVGLGMPTFLSYWRASTLRGGTQEVTAVLNQGRQLAIRENQTVCIQSNVTPGTYGTQLRYLLGTSCTATQTCVVTSNVAPCIWTGAGTDSNGYVTLSNSMQVAAPTTNVTFSYLGAAQGGTFLVCNPNDTVSHATVTVASSGRISTAYLNTAC